MENCAYCKEEILPHEQTDSLTGDDRQMHRECWMRCVFGSVADQSGACDCVTGDDCDDPELTTRENARAAAAYFAKRVRRVGVSSVN